MPLYLIRLGNRGVRVSVFFPSDTDLTANHASSETRKCQHNMLYFSSFRAEFKDKLVEIKDKLECNVFGRGPSRSQPLRASRKVT